MSQSHKSAANSPSFRNGTEAGGHLKIGDVARLVGVSASVIRSWERLGVIRPARTESKYRIYSEQDLKLLKRARFLNRVRGLNGPAIVELLKARGEVQPVGANGIDLLGRRLRQLRMSHQRSLAEVAQAVGISVGFLSAIERSQMSASVGTLRRLTRYYKLNILDFFDTARQANSRLVRRGDRKRLHGGPGVQMDLLAWGNTVMEPHLFTIAPGAGSGESYSHEGEEFIFVIRGRLNIALDGEEYLLKSGDSFYFASTTPHSWRNGGKTETVLLWVNTPPTF